MSKHPAHSHGHGHTHAHAHRTEDLDWDTVGPSLEEEAELSRPQYEAAARWIADLPEAQHVRRVLDIGSGPGVISCLLAEVFPGPRSSPSTALRPSWSARGPARNGTASVSGCGPCTRSSRRTWGSWTKPT